MQFRIDLSQQIRYLSKELDSAGVEVQSRRGCDDDLTLSLSHIAVRRADTARHSLASRRLLPRRTSK